MFPEKSFCAPSRQCLPRGLARRYKLARYDAASLSSRSTTRVTSFLLTTALGHELQHVELENSLPSAPSRELSSHRSFVLFCRS